MPDEKQTKVGAVMALAGRRIDAEGACPERFPMRNRLLVRQRLKELLFAEGAAALVCSAACGADLIALEVAKELGLPRRIVLPFEPGRFRHTSVTDRPGDWGPVFDCLIEAAKATGDLVVLQADAEGSEASAYAAANERIVLEAAARARESDPPMRAVSVVVWEGAPKNDDDATEGFRALATNASFESREVRTL
jgi:hypothetical protein